MAHDLDIAADGRVAFATAREDAWHQLGTTLESTFSAEEAMREAYLGGWNVRKSPLFTPGPNGDLIQVPDKFAVVRDNPFEEGQIDILGGAVGGRYLPIQNEAHAELLTTLVDESGAHFETAGSLDGGRKVFITMKLPGHITIGGVDPVDNYIVAINSHDGSTAFTLMVTPVRVVCKNTMNLAFGGASHMFRAKHTLGADRILIQQAREALDMTFDYLDAFQAQARQLIDTELTQRRFDELITGAWGVSDDAHPTTLTRTSNKLDEMSALFSAQTQEGIAGTAWAGVNALTEWYDHYSPVKGDERDSTRAQKAVLLPRFKNEALQLMMAA